MKIKLSFVKSQSTHFLNFLSIFLFLYIKKLFEIINLKKPKHLPKKGLKERTLWVVVKKLREKMKNEGGDYSDLRFVSPRMFLLL